MTAIAHRGGKNTTTITNVKIEHRVGIAITRNLGDQSRGTNVRKNPARGVRNQRTKMHVRVANRERSLPNIKERGRFFLNFKLFFETFCLCFVTTYIDIFFNFSGSRLHHHHRHHRRRLHRPIRVSLAMALPQIHLRILQNYWRNCKSNDRSRSRNVNVRKS